MVRSQHAQLVYEWAHDILKFTWEVFGVVPSSQQAKAMVQFQDMVWAKIHVSEGISANPKEVAVSKKFGMSIMSGVGTGKGALASWCIIWFLSCFPYPKIAVTSPSAKQLNITLWAELAKWHQKSKLKEWFTWQSDKYYFNEQQGQQWFAVTRTANTRNSPEEQAETLAGLHEDYLLIVGDESSGIPDPVFRPLESTLTRKCNLCLLLFNPTRAKGFAYDTHHKDRENWIPIHWNAEESTNVTKDSIERLAKKYGRDSNTFRIRVLGIPPVAGENNVIPWEWIEQAVDREVEPLENDQLIYSFDVGAGGDDSIMLKRHGPKIYPLEAASFAESTTLTDWAVRQILAGEPKACLIDSIGVGWGVSGDLRKRLTKVDMEVVDVNVAQTAFNSHRFYRLRDELWWRAREEFEKGYLSIPEDALLMGDLNAPRYEDVTGKVKIESKKDMKARGVESPNRADALIMTEIFDQQMVRKIYGASLRKKKPANNVNNWRLA